VTLPLSVFVRSMTGWLSSKTIAGRSIGHYTSSQRWRTKI